MNEKQNGENRDSFDELVKQAEAEYQSSKPDIGYQRLFGCLGGCMLGFILSVALFFVLLILDQKFSKPTDPDFANPIGVILFVFMATAVSGVLGIILCPFLVASFKRARARRQK